MSIEFLCPACQAQIRVAEGASGKKGSCPHCRARLLVPTANGGTASLIGDAPQTVKPPTPSVEFQAASPEDDPPDKIDFGSETLPQNPLVGQTTDPLMETFNPDELKPTPRSSSRRRVRKKSSAGGLLIPLLFGGILFGAIGWYFYQNRDGLSGTVAGAVVTDPELPEGRISQSDFSGSKEIYEEVRDSLAQQNLSLVDAQNLLKVQIVGTKFGLTVRVSPTRTAQCVKVTLSDPKIRDFVADHAREFNETRIANIQQQADAFFTAWNSTADKATIPNLNEYREHLALASVVSGFGYHLEAFDGKNAIPCAAVGSSGELFFCVPQSAQSFVIRGRDVGGDTTFPGEITVTLGGAASSTAPESPPETCTGEMIDPASEQMPDPVPPAGDKSEADKPEMKPESSDE